VQDQKAPCLPLRRRIGASQTGHAGPGGSWIDKAAPRYCSTSLAIQADCFWRKKSTVI
jgi:hypothetical protein